MPPIKSILTACALLASFAGGYWLADNGWQKTVSKERADTATHIAQLSEQHRKKEHELAKNAEALDQKYTADLSAAERRIDELSDSLAAGSRRLRVKATCPSAMPSSSTTSSMGDAATVELSAIAADTIFSIREGIISDQVKLVYLQSYVKDIVKQCKRL